MNDTQTKAYEDYAKNKDEIIRRIGMRISWLLKKNDLRQKDVGISKTTVSNMIHYNRCSQLDNYILIAAHLKVPLSDLISYNDVGTFDCLDYDDYKAANAHRFECYKNSSN